MSEVAANASEPVTTPDPASEPEQITEPELEHSRAPFMEHLVELRWRLWRAILGVIGAALLCGLFYEYTYAFITEPLYEVLENHKLRTALSYRSVTGPFLFHFKVAILGGIFFGIPVVLYQLWSFVAPGLYGHERKMALPFVFMSTVCFVGGGSFAYFFVLPEAFDFLIGFTVAEGHQLLPDITIEDYLGFTTKLLLAFGIVFEMPVAVGFFAGIGLVTHRGMIKFWRWAVVGAFVLAALLTPPDYITQTMLAVPLVTLYGLSIGIAWFITSRREAEFEDEPDDPEDPEAASEDPEAASEDPDVAPKATTPESD
jgi:sec-independent protein translocase protein TatC